MIFKHYMNDYKRVMFSCLKLEESNFFVSYDYGKKNIRETSLQPDQQI